MEIYLESSKRKNYEPARKILNISATLSIDPIVQRVQYER